MVRRRSTKAAKANTKPRGVNHRESHIKKWNTVEDISMDEEDEFHASRDRILLEGEENVEDDYGEEEEVFSLKGIPETDSDDDGDAEEEGNYEEDGPTKKSNKKSKLKASKKTKAAVQSSSESDDESEPEESWGTKKSAYYSSNAAQLESEDDEANDMEEREAARLQAKFRDALADDDFGLEDAVEVARADEDALDLTDAPSQSAVPTLPTDKKAIIKHLEKTSPETLALARDWEDIVENLIKTKSRVEQLETETNDGVLLGMAHLHYQALLTYATTLAFYLHLRASPEYAANPSSLRSHPVLARLLTLKQSLSILEDLDFGAGIGSDASDLDDLEDDEDIDMMDDTSHLWRNDKKKGLQRGELDDLATDAQFKAFMAAYEAAKAQPAESGKAGEEEAARPKKKRKTKSSSSSQPAFDLVEPSLSSFSHSSSKTPRQPDANDAYGDPTALAHADALDKSARKRSLQFYTAKIDSSAAKRERARAQWGGDDDVPYRERKREKKVEEARKRGLVGGEDLDGEEPERRVVEEGEEEEGEGEDGYYSLVKKKKKERKEQKKAEYETMKAASRPEYHDDEAEGPRALTRAILKNKGLTPHRSKSVRNPRVKKRQKFEKAKKKIASQKPVYKAGAGDAGRYEGERSGISKVVKSVRL